MKFNLKLLQEANRQSKYNKVLEMLKGHDPNVKTIAIMSGQNPNAQQYGDAANAQLKNDLEAELKSQGLKFVRVGGKFMSIFEQSVIILNGQINQIAQLNRDFGQWGFLWGEKFTIEPGNDTMLFTMYQIDYEGDMGFKRASGSERVSDVLGDDQMQGVDDNYTFIPKSQVGDDKESRVGKRFNIPVYEDKKRK